MADWLEIEKQFWELVQICAHGDLCKECCWDTKRVTFSVPGKIYNAPRLAYEISRGALLLSSEFYVCHSCDRGPICCQPAHLWIGTQLDNARDRRDKKLPPSGFKQVREYGEKYGHTNRRTYTVLYWVKPNGKIWLPEDAIAKRAALPERLRSLLEP